jgi:hypothetical protein
MKFTPNFPRSIRLDISIALALLLMILQLATGTSLPFAELTFLAIVAAVLTINLVGGLRTIAGCCVAIVAMQVFIIAEIAKVCYHEPGQYLLDAPLVTMGVIALSMICLCLAALLCRPFKPRRVLFKPILDPGFLRTMAVVTFIIGTSSYMAGQVLGTTDEGAVHLGGFAGLFRRIGVCAPVAIVAGTAYTIIESRGKRLFSIYNALPFGFEFAVGVFFTSKQAMFEPFLYLALTGLAFRFPWRRLHIVSGLAILFLAVFVFFPFAQVARNYTRGYTLGDTWQKTVQFFDQIVNNPSSYVDLRDEYLQGLEVDDPGRYFDTPNGWLERAALIKPADSLIEATLQQGTSGWKTIRPGLEDLVPRQLLPRRYVNVSNELGYRAGLIDEDNIATSISFGFAAEGFSSFGWAGAAIVPFLLGVLLFMVTKYLTSEMTANIWAVVFLGSYQHLIAEASIGGVLQVIIYQTAWNIISFFTIYAISWCWTRLTRGPKPAGTGPGQGPIQSLPPADALEATRAV